MNRPPLSKKGDWRFGQWEPLWAEVEAGNQIGVRTYRVDTREKDAEFSLGIDDAVKLGMELLRAAMEQGWRPS